MPKVSVIIPVYNVESYLRNCLDSVVNQTLQDIEIICVDDGSPDNCGVILDEYAQRDNRVKVIHQENKGLSGARRVGMEIATGDYVAHIDSDDFIEKNYLYALYTSAKKYTADISVAPMKFYNNEKTSDAARFAEEIICDDLYDKCAFLRNDEQSFWISVVNKLYSKNLIEQLKKHPNPEDLNLGEDCLWMLKAAYFANKIVGTMGSCYYYRYNPNSITHSDTDKNKKDKNYTILEIIAFMNACRFSKDCFEVVLLNCIYHNLFDKSNYLYFIEKAYAKIEYNKWLLKLALYLSKLKIFIPSKQKHHLKLKYKYLKQLSRILSQSPSFNKSIKSLKSCLEDK